MVARIGCSASLHICRFQRYGPPPLCACMFFLIWLLIPYLFSYLYLIIEATFLQFTYRKIALNHRSFSSSQLLNLTEARALLRPSVGSHRELFHWSVSKHSTEHCMHVVTCSLNKQRSVQIKIKYR